MIFKASIFECRYTYIQSFVVFFSVLAHLEYPYNCLLIISSLTTSVSVLHYGIHPYALSPEAPLQCAIADWQTEAPRGGTSSYYRSLT